MNLNRLENESLIEYHKRLIYGKLVDKTLSDVDYTELSKLVYDQTYSSDVARRMMYGSRKTLELLDSQLKSSTNNEYAKELDNKILELQKERQKFYDQRREFSKLVSAEARFEHILSEISLSAKSISENTSAIYENLFNFDYDVSNSEAILFLSDWHYGLKTENIFNKYNTDICVLRVTEIAKKSAQKLILHKCKKLHIVVLGDLIHGAIHNSARVASEELVCDQLMHAAELLAQTIEVLSSFVEETNVYVTYGNHARTIQNKKDSIHRDNSERLIPWWLEQRLSKYENIHITEDNGTEFIIVFSCGDFFCASHGDNDSVVSSPKILHTLFQRKYERDVEYMIFGDKHHRESLEELGITSMICGSLCGSDDYANGKRLYSSPSQLMLIVNEEDGVDAEYRLKC